MPGTYSQLLFHLVFSTRRRHPWLTPDVQSRLYPYLGGLIRAEEGHLYAIGGIADHVHLLLRWRTDESLANLLRTLKSRSSLWVHQTFPALAAFAWQEGYAAFSVSKSQESVVHKYIAAQVAHHRTQDFRAELLHFLHAHAIDFDERYLTD